MKPSPTRKKWNPRFVAYAKSHGNSPAQQLKADDKKYPGGQMLGFILWIAKQITAFRKLHPDAFVNKCIADQDAFTKFLRNLPPQ